jgi:FkbM family methyltransferase
MKAIVKAITPEFIQQGIRRVMFARRLKAYKHRVVEHVYHGQKLNVSLQDELAAGWYDQDWGKMPELTLLQSSRLKPKATVFDIGAHQGVVAMVLSRLVGADGQVVAVEGTRHNARVAVENCRLNGVENIHVRHAVGAAQAGLTMTFSETLNGAVDARLLPVNVISVSVDSLAGEFEHPDVVFIDVEGYECQVLEGARATIARGADFFVEVHTGIGLEKFGSVKQVLANFKAEAFDLFWAKAEGAEFVALANEACLPDTKFFLVALARPAGKAVK